jgi:hypothetical protein
MAHLIDVQQSRSACLQIVNVAVVARRGSGHSEVFSSAGAFWVGDYFLTVLCLTFPAAAYR